MQQFNIHEAKTHLSKLLDQVAAGEEIIIARYGKPIAKLCAVDDKAQLLPRKGGQMKGKIWIADDFDAPDPEIEAMFYGDGTV